MLLSAMGSNPSASSTLGGLYRVGDRARLASSTLNMTGCEQKKDIQIALTPTLVFES